MDKAINRTDKRAIQIIKLQGMAKVLIFASALLPILASCVKDELHNTPHPDKGAVMVTTDWSGRSSEAPVPGSYVLRIGTREQTVSGETNAYDALFLPGRQDLLVYNLAEEVTVSGSTATVNTRADGTLEPLPGYLFSAARALDIVEDDTLKVSVAMQQRIRALTLTLKLNPGDEQRITATSATLTGVASAINLTDGSITATTGMATAPAFAIGTDHATRATGQPVLAAVLRLLGMMNGEKQVLTLVVTLTDGTVQTIVTDLTEALKNFGTGDMEPLALDATLELPQEAGFTATISDWNVVDNGEIEIN